MVWGVCNIESCEEEILSPLGLISYGGGTNIKNGKMTYHIKSKKGDFSCEIDVDKIKEFAKLYARGKKIQKIKIK